MSLEREDTKQRARKRLQLIGACQSSFRTVATLRRKNSTPSPEAFFSPSLAANLEKLEAVGGAERRKRGRKTVEGGSGGG